MKNIKSIVFIFITMLLVVACSKDDDYDISTIDAVTAPTNVRAIFDVTQDNSGLVTIAPLAEGVSKFNITFGDVQDEIPSEYGLNEVASHIYEEGVYTVGISAIGPTALTTTITEELNVTFKAPENLVVSIAQDAVNPKVVNVSATADFVTVVEVYFGDQNPETPTMALPDETVSHTYDQPGDYVVRVIAKSAGAATTEYTETINIPEASDPILFPIDFESFTVRYAFNDFGNAVSTVVDNPDASGINFSTKVGQTMKNNGSEVWAGSLLTMGEQIDFSTEKLMHVKVWSPKVGAIVKLKVENLDDGNIAHEVDMSTTVANTWEELTYDFSGIDLSQTYQKLVLFFDFGNAGDDAIYYFDDLRQSAIPTGIPAVVGTWRVAPEASGIGVGPALGDISWWSNSADDVTTRDCFFDDTYVFNIDGTFQNVVGATTWVEGWQGGGDACETPVAPHDGSIPATYIFDQNNGTVTLNGQGAFLGIPKAINGGELASPGDAPATITYDVAFMDNNNTMIVDINIGGGWWRYKLVKDAGPPISPLAGTWVIAPEASALGVGPELGDISWWSNSLDDVTTRGCFFDDEYVFGFDGSFSNVLGGLSWIETWQGGSESCDATVAPHDGSIPATFVYDELAGTVTLNGQGSYLGIPKAINGGELTSPGDAPASVTYDIALMDQNATMIADINIGGGWWRFKLVKK